MLSEKKVNQESLKLVSGVRVIVKVGDADVQYGKIVLIVVVGAGIDVSFPTYVQVKRGRGRPRKFPRPEDVLQSLGTSQKTKHSIEARTRNIEWEILSRA